MLSRFLFVPCPSQIRCLFFFCVCSGIFATPAKQTSPSGKTGNHPEQVTLRLSASLAAFADVCCRRGGKQCKFGVKPR
uniref:Putative secreted protein n=1 Tax=Ixodes ricinus TaxID=34613 RepID=A0A147BBD9_IXORI